MQDSDSNMFSALLTPKRDVSKLRKSLSLSKIPWKHIRQDIRLNRYLIAGLGMFLLLLAGGQTAGGINLVSSCRLNLHYSACFPAGDACSRMGIPAFAGCSVVFSLLCAVTCASTKTLAALLLMVLAGEFVLGLYIQFSAPMNRYLKNFLPMQTQQLIGCEKLRDNMTMPCWYHLGLHFPSCDIVYHVKLTACNVTMSGKLMPKSQNGEFDAVNIGMGKYGKYGPLKQSDSPRVQDMDRQFYNVPDHAHDVTPKSTVFVTGKPEYVIFKDGQELSVKKHLNVTEEFLLESSGFSVKSVIAKRELCFEDVMQHTKSHFGFYKDLTVIVLLVSATIHLLCAIILCLLDKKAICIRSEIKHKKFHVRPEEDATTVKPVTATNV
ncbi:uncharacterized protein LOC135494842 [Lineus longissimus]|uniref:uncharacterized protein LOC135494842 n=1 Tax=Lineus longissimus TaxID=88925 RepID=UPI00315C9C5D